MYGTSSLPLKKSHLHSFARTAGMASEIPCSFVLWVSLKYSLVFVGFLVCSLLSVLSIHGGQARGLSLVADKAAEDMPNGLSWQRLLRCELLSTSAARIEHLYSIVCRFSNHAWRAVYTIVYPCHHFFRQILNKRSWTTDVYYRRRLWLVSIPPSNKSCC